MNNNNNSILVRNIFFPMEVLFNVVGGFVVEVGKNVCKCIYPKIENIICFSSKIENLRKEMAKLPEYKDYIKKKLEVAEREGYKPKPHVIVWIEDVSDLKNVCETTQESIAAAKMLAYKCCPKFSLRSEVSAQLEWKIGDQLYRLKEVREKFGSNLVVENYQMKKVEFIPGPSIQGQLAATQNLNKILKLLEDDKVNVGTNPRYNSKCFLDLVVTNFISSCLIRIYCQK